MHLTTSSVEQQQRTDMEDLDCANDNISKKEIVNETMNKFEMKWRASLAILGQLFTVALAITKVTNTVSGYTYQKPSP